jgi:hypothetical protein
LFFEEVEEVESSNSHVVGELRLDEMPLISGVDSLVPRSPPLEVSLFHVIFNLNKILVATHFNKGKYGKLASCIVILKPRLKKSLKRCVSNSMCIFGP